MLPRYSVQKNSTLVLCCGDGRLHLGCMAWSSTETAFLREVGAFQSRKDEVPPDHQATVIVRGDDSAIRVTG
jgi:hypothetical protein